MPRDRTDGAGPPVLKRRNGPGDDPPDPLPPRPRTASSPRASGVSRRVLHEALHALEDVPDLEKKPRVVPIHSWSGVSSQTSQAATNSRISVTRQPLRQPRPGIFMGLALR